MVSASDFDAWVICLIMMGMAYTILSFAVFVMLIRRRHLQPLKVRRRPRCQVERALSIFLCSSEDRG